jgi:transposase InsO family protein
MRGYAELPPHDAPLAAWCQVTIDLIGPWTIKVDAAHQSQFRALTIIDTTTNFPEIIHINNQSAAHIGQQFKNPWLSRYPWLLQCIYDQGTKFTGAHFQGTLRHHGIQVKPTTGKNPQANAVVERLHQTITNSMRAALTASPPDTQQDINLIVDTILQNTAYAIQAFIHCTLKATPESQVFHQDMILDIPLVADLIEISQRRQQLIDQKMIEANHHRISHYYQPADEVLVLTHNPDKLEPRAHGPYRVEQVHVNGTTTIRRAPGITEQINIRPVKPCHR